jgi:DNA uptake protein ComE-like DNA-binding protein
VSKLRILALAVIVSSAIGPALAQTPQTGGAPAGKAAAPSAAPAKPEAKPETSPAAKLIDINTATKDELDVLPGIGPARAEAIIKGRPYNGKDELRRKNILPDSVYQGIKDRIVARQS